jgi:hypothetical protein
VIIDATIPLPAASLTGKRVIILPRQLRAGKERRTYDRQSPLAHPEYPALPPGAHFIPVGYPAFLQYVHPLLEAQYAILTLHLPETIDGNAHQAAIAERFANSRALAVRQVPALSLGASFIAERLIGFCKQPGVSLAQANAYFDWLVAHLETLLIDEGKALPFVINPTSALDQWKSRLQKKLRLSLLDKHLLAFTILGYTAAPRLELSPLQRWLKRDRPQEALLKGNFNGQVLAELKQALSGLGLRVIGTYASGLESWYLPQRFVEICLVPSRIEIQRAAKELLEG